MENNIIKTTLDENHALPEISIENRLEIIDEGVRKKYLARLSEMEIAAFSSVSKSSAALKPDLRQQSGK